MKNLLPLAVATTILMFSAGCTSTSSSGSVGGDEDVTGNGVTEEYQDTVEGFPYPLPDGMDFPEGPPDELLESNSSPGVGLAPPYFFWLCAWEVEYLEAFAMNDPANIESSLAMIAKWPDTEFVQTYVEDPENGWYKAVLAPAELGDPSGVRAEVENGCADFGFDLP